MYKLNFFLLAIASQSVEAFVPSLPSGYVNLLAITESSSVAFVPQIQLRMAEGDEGESGGMSFDDAGAAIREEEEQARAERSGSSMSEEKNVEFEAKKTEYESMREKIRARATDLNIEKSVTTQKAIEDANRRAMAREEPQEIDLSKFGMGSIGEDPEDELTEEQKATIDKTGQMNVVSQAVEEIKSAKFPGLGATLRQTAFMLVIFAFTAGYILFLDGFLRDFFTDVLKIIPSPDATFDYSDLDLPDGWTEMMDENDLMKQ